MQRQSLFVFNWRKLDDWWVLLMVHIFSSLPIIISGVLFSSVIDEEGIAAGAPRGIMYVLAVVVCMTLFLKVPAKTTISWKEALTFYIVVSCIGAVLGGFVFTLFGQTGVALFGGLTVVFVTGFVVLPMHKKRELPT